jgi:hypothetical protein
MLKGQMLTRVNLHRKALSRTAPNVEPLDRHEHLLHFERTGTLAAEVNNPVGLREHLTVRGGRRATHTGPDCFSPIRLIDDGVFADGGATVSGKTITRADLCEAVHQRVGLSRTESATLVELVLKEITFRNAQAAYQFRSGMERGREVSKRGNSKRLTRHRPLLRQFGGTL